MHVIPKNRRRFNGKEHNLRLTDAPPLEPTLNLGTVICWTSMRAQMRVMAGLGSRTWTDGYRASFGTRPSYLGPDGPGGAGGRGQVRSRVRWHVGRGENYAKLLAEKRSVVDESLKFQADLLNVKCKLGLSHRREHFCHSFATYVLFFTSPVVESFCW